MTTNQAGAHRLRDERGALHVRSGVEDAPSSGGSGTMVRAAAAPRYFDDDWGIDAAWGEPAPYVFDQEIDPRTAEDFRDPWTRMDKWIVGVSFAVIALAWFAGMAGWLS